MKFLKDTAMGIMIKISFQVFTFSIQTKKVASAVAGSSRKVSNNTTNSKLTLRFFMHLQPKKEEVLNMDLGMLFTQ